MSSCNASLTHGVPSVDQNNIGFGPSSQQCSHEPVCMYTLLMAQAILTTEISYISLFKQWIDKHYSNLARLHDNIQITAILSCGYKWIMPNSQQPPEHKPIILQERPILLIYQTWLFPGITFECHRAMHLWHMACRVWTKTTSASGRVVNNAPTSQCACTHYSWLKQS